jgi:hypothetical protein
MKINVKFEPIFGEHATISYGFEKFFEKRWWGLTQKAANHGF